MTYWSKTVEEIQRALGCKADGYTGPKTRRAVRAFQQAHGLKADGIIGPNTTRAAGEHFGLYRVLPATQANLREHCMKGTTLKETGGVPDRVNANFEARGVFDKPAAGRYHWASYRHPNNDGCPIMLGGSFALNQAMQDSGATGLWVMDIPESVRRECGLEPAHEAVLCAPGAIGDRKLVPARPGVPWEQEWRGARVQRVNGEDMWEGENLRIMKRLARHPEGIAAAYRQMYFQYLKPMLPHARLWTAAELAVLFDIANANGVRGARRKLPESWSSVEELIEGAFETDKPRQRRFDVARTANAFVSFERPA